MARTFLDHSIAQTSRSDKCKWRRRSSRHRLTHITNITIIIAVLAIALYPHTAYAKNDKSNEKDENKRNQKEKKEEKNKAGKNKDDKDKQGDKNKQDGKEKEDKKNKQDDNKNEQDAEKQPKDAELPSCTLCADTSEADVFLESRELGRSCSELSAFAQTLEQGNEGCRALQVIGFQDCGCPTYPEGFCTLCHGGFFDIPNKETLVPSTKNYKCKDILFVEESALTDGCSALHPYQEMCGCPSMSKSCPVCDHTAQEYHKDKLFKEYGLTCENLGMARDMGYTSSCVDIQIKFRYFCGCPGATPECTLCQQGEVPPELEKVIPTLNTTCEEVNDYASLYSQSECAMELNMMDYNAAGFCGCAYYGPLLQCNFCDEGKFVVDPDKIPQGSSDGSTCGELEEFAGYIWTPTDLCANVQNFAGDCCS